MVTLEKHVSHFSREEVRLKIYLVMSTPQLHYSLFPLFELAFPSAWNIPPSAPLQFAGLSQFILQVTG